MTKESKKRKRFCIEQRRRNTLDRSIVECTVCESEENKREGGGIYACMLLKKVAVFRKTPIRPVMMVSKGVNARNRTGRAVADKGSAPIVAQARVVCC